MVSTPARPATRCARGGGKLCERLEPRQLLAAGPGEIIRPEGTLYSSPATLWNASYQLKVTYIDDKAMDVRTLDSGDLTVYGPNGFARPARFYRSASAGPAVASAWYKLSAPGGVWDAADNGVYTVKVNPHQVRDGEGNSSRAVSVGTFTVAVPEYPSSLPRVGGAAGSDSGLDVTRFGAIPDDGRDDTDAIQRAIDSLPRDGDGVPDPLNPIGGIIYLPAGTFNTNRPLKLPTSVRLRGAGEATVLANTGPDRTRGAIELISTHGHGYNIRAGVERMTITTAAAKGVYATDLGEGDLIGLSLKDLKISAGDVAIDLRSVRAYQTEITNVVVQDPGSTALWIGAEDWWSAINRIDNLLVQGRARSNFRAERAMVVLGGDATVHGLTITSTGAAVTPLYARGTPSLQQVSLMDGAAPGGVLARFEDCTTVQLDRLELLGGARRIEVRDTHNIRIDDLLLDDAAQLASAVSLDNLSHATIGTLRARTGSDADAADPRRFTVAAVDAIDAGPAPLQFASDAARPVGTRVVSALDFGATPNDLVDDTAAIQAAIDAIPTGNGIPTNRLVGGTVVLPAGKFRTSRPIHVPSGVWVRGQGHATVINNTSSDSGGGAFEFVSNHAHGYNVGAGVMEIAIHTAHAMGIRAHESISGGLVDVRIADVQVSAGSRAVDLSPARTYHADLQNVVVSTPGSTALYLGDRDGYSADNRVAGLQLQGSARPGFRGERALVMLGGEYLFEDGWIEHPAVNVLPLMVSGSATIRGLWLEYPPENVPDGVVAQFENVVRADVDRLLHIDPRRRLNLVNARDVRIGMLDLTGDGATLRDVLTVDGRSRLTVGVVNTTRDAGLLDHPRVRVESFHNAQLGVLLPNRVPSAAENLVLDPSFQGSFESSSRGGFSSDHWTISWGDALGEVRGEASVVSGLLGPRLRIVITSNPNNRAVTVAGKLNVPTSLAGRTAVARWRLDGAAQSLVYTRDLQREYSARAANGATAALVPGGLQGGDHIIFLLPRAAGTYYLSQISVALA